MTLLFPKHAYGIRSLHYKKIVQNEHYVGYSIYQGVSF